MKTHFLLFFLIPNYLFARQSTYLGEYGGGGIIGTIIGLGFIFFIIISVFSSTPKKQKPIVKKITNSNEIDKSNNAKQISFKSNLKSNLKLIKKGIIAAENRTSGISGNSSKGWEVKGNKLIINDYRNITIWNSGLIGSKGDIYFGNIKKSFVVAETLRKTDLNKILNTAQDKVIIEDKSQGRLIGDKIKLYNPDYEFTCEILVLNSKKGQVFIRKA